MDLENVQPPIAVSPTKDTGERDGASDMALSPQNLVGNSDAAAELVGDMADDAASEASAGTGKHITFTVHGKDGEAPRKLLIAKGGQSPCLVCGRVFDEMPHNSCYCFPHHRAVHRLKKRWAPLPKAKQPPGYVNVHVDKWDLYNKYEGTVQEGKSISV